MYSLREKADDSKPDGVGLTEVARQIGGGVFVGASSMSTMTATTEMHIHSQRG